MVNQAAGLAGQKVERRRCGPTEIGDRRSHTAADSSSEGMMNVHRLVSPVEVDQ
jgi:hypothetical protein